MKINAFGTDNFLRHQIRSRLEKIRSDDKVSQSFLLPLPFSSPQIQLIDWRLLLFRV
jgi:hypothetical protein